MFFSPLEEKHRCGELPTEESQLNLRSGNSILALLEFTIFLTYLTSTFHKPKTDFGAAAGYAGSAKLRVQDLGPLMA
jgi:hypothetical protein